MIQEAEHQRLLSMRTFEKKAFDQGFVIVAGTDEVGRGPIAGPVVAAACILPPDLLLEGINDSKLLSKEKREEIFHLLTTNPNVCYKIVDLSSAIIDEINILQASLLAMKRAVEGLLQKPDYVLIDGNQKPLLSMPSKAIIKGDSRSVSIAAASILAKVTRDHMMRQFHDSWPEYGFHQHKGYATKSHLQAVEEFGPCPIHRVSFSPFKLYDEQLTFFDGEF